MLMNTSRISLETIQSRIAHAMETAGTRTPEEQLDLLADLLAEAFNAREVYSPESREPRTRTWSA